MANTPNGALLASDHPRMMRDYMHAHVTSTSSAAGLAIGLGESGQNTYSDPNYQMHPGSSSNASNLWGYSVPSPRHTVPTATFEDSPTQLHAINIQQATPGYNLSNTRPMTAPSGTNAPANYHGAGYGGMFSPATYSGAGFPQFLTSRQVLPPSGLGSNFRRARTFMGPGQHQLEGDYIGSSGLSSEEPSRAITGSSSDPFLHQAPGISPNYQHMLQYQRPEHEWMPRRASEGFSEYNRSGMSDTARPDTAASAFSSYSTGSGDQHGFPPTHHFPYNMVSASDPESSGSITELAPTTGGNPQKYNFVPLPNQPKKRPRRRFEEIERLYDCNYPGCNKAYGTLNHLNAHASMQKHGPKRLPSEFKEVRKAWRQRKKDHDAVDIVGPPTRIRPNNNGPLTSFASHGSSGPHLPSVATTTSSSSSVTKQHHQIGNGPYAVSPPSSSSKGATQGFQPVNSLHEIYNSPNHYPRPSTAPGRATHYSFGNTPPGPHHGSSLNGQIPSGYLVARKSSITSLPPSFAAIEEDTLGEHASQLGQMHSTQFSASHPQSHPHHDYLVSDHDSLIRPSTASSLFRYNASGHSVTDGMKSSFESIERRATTSDGLHGLSALSDPHGLGSLEWSSGNNLESSDSDLHQ